MINDYNFFIMNEEQEFLKELKENYSDFNWRTSDDTKYDDGMNEVLKWFLPCMFCFCLIMTPFVSWAYFHTDWDEIERQKIKRNQEISRAEPSSSDIPLERIIAY